MNNGIINWSPGVTLEAVEKQVILVAFRFYRGNKTVTSQSLGISIRTLDNKLERYEEDGKQERERYELAKARDAATLDRMRGIAPTEVLEAHRTSLYRADTGVHLESITNAATEPAVSMPERQEVQKVLPRQAPQSGARRSR